MTEQRTLWIVVAAILICAAPFIGFFAGWLLMPPETWGMWAPAR
jgi:hypothetical protein